MAFCHDKNATNVAFQAFVFVTCFAGRFPFLLSCNFVAHLLVNDTLADVCPVMGTRSVGLNGACELANAIKQTIERLNAMDIHVVEASGKDMKDSKSGCQLL